MVWAARPDNQVFSPDEPLFCRVNAGMLAVDADGGVTLNVRVGDQSVNRSDPDGEWGDVLLHDHPKFSDWGVVTFSTGMIPTPQERSGADAAHYRPVHVPEKCNFYHSEIHVRRATPNGERIKNVKPLMKTWFRTCLSERLSAASILKLPTA